MTRPTPILIVLMALLGLLSACNTPAKRQAVSEYTLGTFADGYRLAIESGRLKDPNLIRAGREVLREWNSINSELNAARMFGDDANEGFWLKRLYGDGTPQNPGIIARAAKLALQWEAK